MSPLLPARLAIADLSAERMLALCSVLALAAVLTPLLILGGLRAGVIQGLREALLEDPRTREITTAANRTIDAGVLRQLAARPDVSFLAPRTRTLAASLLLEKPSAPGGGTRVELLATAPGDPLLPASPTRADQIVLSAAAAARLGVSRGDHLIGRLARILNGHRDAAPLDLQVQAVAAPAAFSREGAFVTLSLATMVEDFQDGRIDIPGPLDALPAADRAEFAGFRLYAKRLEDIPALDAALRAQGIEVVSRAGDVAGLLRIDRQLGLLYGLVAGLGGAGFLVSLGAGLWANVERKRAALAQLRFLGLSAGSLRLFPMVQAGLLSLAGVAIGGATALLAAAVINHLFAGTLALDRDLCLIDAGLLLAAAGATLLGGLLVSAAAGTRAGRVEPWEGINTP